MTFIMTGVCFKVGGVLILTQYSVSQYDDLLFTDTELPLEQHGFELPEAIYMWFRFNKYTEKIWGDL